MNIVPQLILNSIIAGAIYALIALGFNLIYGTTKFFNLAHGVLAAVGGYIVFFFANKLGWPLAVAVILGIVGTGVIGWAIDRFIYLKLRQRKATNTVLLVASLGVFTAIQAILAILFTSQFQTLSQHTTTRVYDLGGAVITQIQLLILISGFVILGLLSLLLNRTKLGKAIKAISDDEEVAKMVGIDTNKIIGTVFFIGSAIAGLGGILIGFDTGLEPTMGMGLLLKGTIAAIIGGVGNIYGGILGAFLLGFIENFGIWKISGEWKDAIAFIVLILFLLFRPQGILKR